MQAQILSALSHPVIAAVHHRDQLARAAASDCGAVFILGGDILDIADWVGLLRGAGKQAYVHLDLLEGVGRDAAGVRFVARVAAPDGVISTKAALLRMAQDEGLTTIHRLFLLDSASFSTGVKMVASSKADLVEVMPALVPKGIARMRELIGRPVIAGGMVVDAADVRSALSAGARAVSTSHEPLWARCGLEG